MSDYQGVPSDDSRRPPNPRGWSKTVKILLAITITLQIVVIGFMYLHWTNYKSDANHTKQIPGVQRSLAEMAAAQPGHKLVVPYVTPRANQMSRGTCWDFATIGLLEWSYRANGIKNGWLKPNEYVKLSEQAYGVIVLDRCAQYPKYCIIPNDDVWLNSTNGGEIPMLYNLPNMSNVILPDAVCPYIGHDGADYVCQGLQDALVNNPVNFKIKTMSTMYEINAIKQHLRANGRALGFSTIMTNVMYYFPCVGKDAEKPECQLNSAGQCPTYCPVDRFPGSPGLCCGKITQGNTNKEGEFFSRGVTDFMDGGHAMLLVGYNDNFVTTDGSQGGFILKNNWVTNGTHSIDYFMQEISRWDESIVCPNSANPRNWYTCDTIEKCLSERTKIYASVSRQSLQLICIDPKHCNTAPEYEYFIKNYTHVGDDMHVLCLFEWNGDENTGAEICFDPLVLDTVSRFLRPAVPFENHPDVCGYYFFPYDLVRTWWGRFHDSFVTDFDIEWHPSSYAANKAKYPQFDYSLIEQSTKIQTNVEFSGPFPFEHLPEPNMESISNVRLAHSELVQRALRKEKEEKAKKEKEKEAAHPTTPPQ